MQPVKKDETTETAGDRTTQYSNGVPNINGIAVGSAEPISNADNSKQSANVSAGPGLSG